MIALSGILSHPSNVLKSHKRIARVIARGATAISPRKKILEIMMLHDAYRSSRRIIPFSYFLKKTLQLRRQVVLRRYSASKKNRIKVLLFLAKIALRMGCTRNHKRLILR